MGFRENLKQELSFNGMQVKELAVAAGVHKRALDTYLLTENASMPPADTAVRIAQALGVSVEYLITGENIVLPQDIRQIIRNLTRLSKKNRHITAVLTKALLDSQEDKQ
ncbi:MAG: helix-turn-helix domain-containing protein [Treponema sp.]|nr:helix-turn-helix domain-containing protein [Treponema sp.]